MLICVRRAAGGRLKGERPSEDPQGATRRTSGTQSPAHSSLSESASSNGMDALGCASSLSCLRAVGHGIQACQCTVTDAIVEAVHSKSAPGGVI